MPKQYHKLNVKTFDGITLQSEINTYRVTITFGDMEIVISPSVNRKDGLTIHTPSPTSLVIVPNAANSFDVMERLDEYKP